MVATVDDVDEVSGVSSLATINNLGCALRATLVSFRTEDQGQTYEEKPPECKWSFRFMVRAPVDSSSRKIQQGPPQANKGPRGPTWPTRANTSQDGQHEQMQTNSANKGLPQTIKGQDRPTQAKAGPP